MMPENEKVFEITLGRSVTGSICGAAAIILAILGLVNLLPMVLVAIATIVLGGAMLFKGAVISAEYARLIAHLSGAPSDRMELGGGLSVEIITGAAGIILGILALLTIYPITLISIAIIAIGGGVVIGSSVISRLNSLRFELAGAFGTPHHRVAHEIVTTAMGLQILAGLAAVVLGILSLIGYMPLTLNLIAILVLGSAALLSGAAVTGRMLGMMRNP